MSIMLCLKVNLIVAVENVMQSRDNIQVSIPIIVLYDSTEGTAKNKINFVRQL